MPTREKGGALPIPGVAAKLQAKRDSDPAGLGRPDPAHQKPGEKKLPVSGGASGLQVVVGPEESREYVLTNKEKAYFAGETGTTNTRSYAGLIVELHKFLEGWDLFLGGAALGVRGQERVRAPAEHDARAHRRADRRDGLPLRSENILILTYGLELPRPRRLRASDGHEEHLGGGEAGVRAHWDASARVLALRRTDHARRTKDAGLPGVARHRLRSRGEFVPGSRLPAHHVHDRRGAAHDGDAVPVRAGARSSSSSRGRTASRRT